MSSDSAIRGSREETLARVTHQDELVPHFIIAGTMKSGTTTLHHILDRHPDIFMPPGELKYFVMNDITEHPSFFPRRGGRWMQRDLGDQNGSELKWYLSKYRSAHPDQIRGEDSPSCFTSRTAAASIARLVPNVKLIILLRDPVDRIYSHYWHLMRRRATLSFEDTLRYSPDLLIRRSCYCDHIRRFYQLFRHDQIVVRLFEEFVETPRLIVHELLEAVDCDPNALPTDAFATHENKAHIPRFPAIKRLTNRLFRDVTELPALRRLPVSFELTRRERWKLRALSVVNTLNEAPGRRPPPMDSDTRDFLVDIMRHENRDLPDLIDRDIKRYWPTFH